MALLNCKNCGKEIAESAKSCPYCGQKLKLWVPTKATIGIVCLIVGFVVLGLIFSLSHEQKETQKANQLDDLIAAFKFGLQKEYVHNDILIPVNIQLIDIGDRSGRLRIVDDKELHKYPERETLVYEGPGEYERVLASGFAVGITAVLPDITKPDMVLVSVGNGGSMGGPNETYFVIKSKYGVKALRSPGYGDPRTFKYYVGENSYYKISTVVPFGEETNGDPIYREFIAKSSFSGDYFLRKEYENYLSELTQFGSLLLLLSDKKARAKYFKLTDNQLGTLRERTAYGSGPYHELDALRGRVYSDSYDIVDGQYLVACGCSVNSCEESGAGLVVVDGASKKSYIASADGKAVEYIGSQEELANLYELLTKPSRRLDGNWTEHSEASCFAGDGRVKNIIDDLGYLQLSNGPAYTGRQQVGGNDELGMTTYAEPDTLRRKGKLVKMWDLTDFKTAQTSGVAKLHLSEKRQVRYDCAEERMQVLAFTWFSGHMGIGNVVYSSSDEGKWEPIVPGSIGQALWKFACGKQ